ncbi:MAG: T9SS type A sorting domain-containing protein [Ignavibacteria bacterium]|nr:T9SS type A sorting domain-containing protein [Ignavibacteria bacterium]
MNFAVAQRWNLAWRNALPNPFTKIFAYVGTTNTDISTPATHTISINNGPLPVELASFTAVTNRNNVTLNWATSKETNNQGFEVERSLVGANSWAKVGTVTGNGTTNETRSYSFTERVTTGNYSYRLKQIDFNGNFEYHNLSSEVNVGVPSEFALSQNYPNPFNPSTKIDYDIATDGNVSVVLFDMSGREVAKLVNDFKPAGYYTVSFNASNLSSGMYFYRISANNFSQTKKMVLVK